VCTEVHPEPRDVSEPGEPAHNVACVKHDVFDVGYDESPPLETTVTGGFDASLTETGGDG